ncbi:MAG: sulfur carrier protein ThiS [Paramuribaculum sp.]|nr:sulfur carrier protein ThiS [Candidatus Amulumruptor sp.]MDE6587504.1 sulfur carrier protein ThiS [Paramuribaculum sp.]MDE7152121.1 sulfur carrier protein ThiS [Candidatus Amulumruptor sp.]
MKVEINKKSIEVAPGITTLAQLLSHEKLDGPGQAVAVDNVVVRRADRDTVTIVDGMKITVIGAVCGG